MRKNESFSDPNCRSWCWHWSVIAENVERQLILEDLDKARHDEWIADMMYDKMRDNL